MAKPESFDVELSETEKTKKIILVICVVILAFWCLWWMVSLQQRELLAGRHLWFKPPALGVDFYFHIDLAARTWWNGGDPYANTKHLFAYLPSEMRLFAWVNLVTPRAALAVWLIVMTAIIAAASWTAGRWRRRLLLEDIPPHVALVLILFSTPVVFGMERGQYDILSLLVILAALPLLNHKSDWAQFLAGAVLCLAPWIKVYPGLLLVGLLGLMRWRALAGFIATGIVIAAYFLLTGEMQKFTVNNAFHVRISDYLVLLSSGTLHPWEHPLSTGLASLWLGTKLGGLGLLPGKIMAVTLLGLLLSWVTYHVYRCPARDALTYPYFLWIIALATFVPPISNDYNLIFLPLAVLAVWNRHDPLMVQAALALLLIWWQPIGLPMNANLLFIIKLLGLGAVAVCLVRRLSEQTELAAVAGRQPLRG